MLGQELWALFEERQAEQAPAPSSRVWAERLAAALADRNELRSRYMTGPRRELLRAIKQHYHDNDDADHPNLRRAAALARSLDYEVLGASRPRVEPLEAAAQLADQRARSVGESVVTEELGIAAGERGADDQRLAEMRQLEAGMRLLNGAALLAVEAEHSSTQRRWNRERWRDAMAQATQATPNQVPATLLERLLLLAGRRGPATPAQLQALYGGTGWAETLDALAEIEAVVGDAANGYRATDELIELWRAAGARLRHAVRSDVSVLPGGADLAPLTGTEVRVQPGGPTPRDAYRALRDLLRDGDLAFLHWHDGWIDDAGITWRRLTGLGYRMRHSAGRLSWPLPADHPAAPVRFARNVRDLVVSRWRHHTVPGAQRRLLRGLLRETDAADRIYFRARRAGEFLADQRPDQLLRTEAADLLHAARAAEVEAYARLREARRRAADELKAVGSHLHQVDRALGAADAARPYAPGSDPLPPTADYWLREITRELDAARAQLDRLHPGREREVALAEARLSLERYEIDHAYALAAGLYRTAGGLRIIEAARVAAKKLRAAHQDLFTGMPVAPVPGVSPVIPHRDRVEHPYGDDDLGGPGMAASTRRGLGNRTNQDAATLLTLPNGDRVAVVVDGVFSYPGSRFAAHRFATAFRAEILRTDRVGRTPAEALSDAHQAGLGGLAENYTPEAGHAAVAYLAAYYAADGTITISHLGTARAYYLPLDRTRLETHPDIQLTFDDSRGGDITDGGIMTRWAASDYMPEPAVTTVTPPVPGVLVLATDGLWRYLPKPADLGKMIFATGAGGPDDGATLLADTARNEGGRDDLTVAVLYAPAHGRGLGAARPGLGSGGGGAAALDPLREADRLAVLDALPRMEGRMTPLDALPHRMPRAPPGVQVMVLDGELPVPGVIAFGWAERGVVVITRRMLDEVTGHLAAGRLDAGWWYRLLEHERDFHLPRGGRAPEHTGDRHDAHAAPFAEALRSARAAAPAGSDRRRAHIDEWDPEFLHELTTLSPEDALLTVLAARGMNDAPAPADSARRRELFAAGREPLYRGIHDDFGDRADEWAEQFRTGDRSFVGQAASMGGRGTNFSTDPGVAGRFSEPLLPGFRQMFGGAETGSRAVVIGYLGRHAHVMHLDAAQERAAADVAALRQAGHDEVADRVRADIGLWAALTGVDAISKSHGGGDRHYLVLNRGAMLVEVGEAVAGPAASAAGSVPDGVADRFRPVAMDGWQEVGGRLGSNPGGTYVLPTVRSTTSSSRHRRIMPATRCSPRRCTKRQGSRCRRTGWCCRSTGGWPWRPRCRRARGRTCPSGSPIPCTWPPCSPGSQSMRGWVDGM
ncbi:hypothetical protein BJF90_22055 [Pseudonocardia sp. CNS-004]|nr:hypothetical protein BJF90_22055 [Pseudonocardia sp. CNS-004]